MANKTKNTVNVRTIFPNTCNSFDVSVIDWALKHKVWSLKF